MRDTIDATSASTNATWAAAAAAAAAVVIAAALAVASTRMGVVWVIVELGGTAGREGLLEIHQMHLQFALKRAATVAAATGGRRAVVYIHRETATAKACKRYGICCFSCTITNRKMSFT